MDGLAEGRACPDCGDPGFINPTTGFWQCGNSRCENGDEIDVGALPFEQRLPVAVEALREIAAYEVMDDDDGYLDAVAMQDKARDALNRLGKAWRR
jgi:hypothetical protein